MADAAEPAAPAALEVRELTKSFGAVLALRGVSFSLYRGEVLALLGDNGAGKSTLVKCLAGSIAPDAGAVLIDGREVSIGSPEQARELGVETVYQDLTLVPALNVAENLFLNRELVSAWPLLRQVGWLRTRRMQAAASRTLDRLQIRIPSVKAAVDELSGGQRQAIAVSRAVAWGNHIVLLDEPAAALGVEQSRAVLELTRSLAEAGVAVLFISHNMQHVIESCDRAVVLRHGHKVGDVHIREVTARDLVDLITGARQPDA